MERGGGTGLTDFMARSKTQITVLAGPMHSKRASQITETNRSRRTFLVPLDFKYNIPTVHTVTRRILTNRTIIQLNNFFVRPRYGTEEINLLLFQAAVSVSRCKNKKTPQTIRLAIPRRF